jgi:hypothetical protein
VNIIHDTVVVSDIVLRKSDQQLSPRLLRLFRVLYATKADLRSVLPLSSPLTCSACSVWHEHSGWD